MRQAATVIAEQCLAECRRRLSGTTTEVPGTQAGSVGAAPTPSAEVRPSKWAKNLAKALSKHRAPIVDE